MATEDARYLAPERAVAVASTDSFPELIRLAGLDPSRDLRFQDWSGVDFSGVDLRGFDFTGARLHGCNFKSSRISGARFDQAELGIVHHPTRACRSQNPQAPAAVSDLANLRLASDWDVFAKSWRRRDGGDFSDDHLPVGAIFQDAPFAPEMVIVPAGVFLMGSPQSEKGRSETEGPQHAVTIPRPFAVSRYPVTFAEWDAAQASAHWERTTGCKPRNPSHNGWGRGDYPVINVSWSDAQAYAAWLSATTGKPYCLLSEAKWEYICRAGSETAYSFGDTPLHLGEYAWFRENAGQRTHKVAQKAPNAFGVHDVHGNIWEWCEDVWTGKYGERPSDARSRVNDENGQRRVIRGGWRVVRGGSWESDPRVLRCAYRVASLSTYRSNSTGFRVMRDLAS